MKGCAATWAGMSLIASIVLCAKGQGTTAFTQLAFGLIVLAGAALAGGWIFGGNSPAPSSPRRVIVSDVPYHSENNAKLAAELANQRHVGRNRGGDLDVYVSHNPHNQSGNHAENRHVEWLQEVVPGHTQTRAEEAGIHVHIVSEHERDMRSAQAQNSGRSWDWSLGRVFGEDDD